MEKACCIFSVWELIKGAQITTGAEGEGDTAIFTVLQALIENNLGGK
jgi:phosphotransferase system HPr-like phosphotransfer protein